jgi:hypothetical protein
LKAVIAVRLDDCDGGIDGCDGGIDGCDGGIDGGVKAGI